MDIKLIAMDLDGTALQPDHLTISGKLKKALQQAHDRGIFIVPVTGRPYRLLPPFLLGHPAWESYAVLCNGAQIRDLRTDRVHAHFPLEREHLQKVLKIVERYDLPAEFNSDGRLYLTQKSLSQEMQEPKLLFHCRAFLPKHGSIVENLEDCCQMQVEKVHMNCIPRDRWNQIQQDLRNLDVSVVCEKPPNLEVTHRCATKGQGLAALCRELSIPLGNVMAIGDSGNDLSMLETAGFSVAMGSSPDYIKSAANAITGSNLEDGAAEAILKYVLQ